MREIIAVLVVLAVLGTLEALLQLSRFLEDRKVEELRRRLRHIGQGQALRAGSLLRQGKLASSVALDALLRSLPLTLQVEALLIEADVAINVAQLLTLVGAVGVGGALVGVVLGGSLLAAVLMAFIGAMLPFLVVLVVRNRRSAKMSEQLPDALDMMSRAMRAGHGIANSFEFVAGEMPEPINIEFGRAYEEQRLGRSLEDAVLEMTRRVPRNQDLKILAVSILVQKETGGNLAEILESIAETIRARFRFYGKLRSLTAEGRMSGLVLGSLPLLMMTFLALVNPSYLMPLFDDALGLSMLAYAVLSWAFGLAWMFRMTRVEY